MELPRLGSFVFRHDSLFSNTTCATSHPTRYGTSPEPVHPSTPVDPNPVLHPTQPPARRRRWEPPQVYLSFFTVSRILSLNTALARAAKHTRSASAAFTTAPAPPDAAPSPGEDRALGPRAATTCWTTCSRDFSATNRKASLGRRRLHHLCRRPSPPPPHLKQKPMLEMTMTANKHASVPVAFRSPEGRKRSPYSRWKPGGRLTYRWSAISKRNTFRTSAGGSTPNPHPRN